MTNKLRLTSLCLALFFACSARADLWFATGPFGGDAEVVRTVPKVRGLVIAAAHNGLIYTSTTGGATWRNLYFPGQFSGVLHALEVDPRSASTWYVGIESESEWVSGIYKTTDSGDRWTLLPETKGLAVWSIALWPGNPDTIAAGTGKGVYLSQDAGGTWKHISPPDDPEIRPVVSLAFHPEKSNILYAGTTHLPWRTTDGGKTWSSIHTGMMDDSDVFSIQVDARRPERVFASACSGVYGSLDSAEKWSHLDTPKGAFRTHFVALDPSHEGVVFAGTTGGLLRSSDNGHNWRNVSSESIKSIAFDPLVPGRIFFASTTAGILLSTDGGLTLHDCNVGFTNRNFTALTGSGFVLYASSVFEAASGGLYRSDTLGLRWLHQGTPRQGTPHAGAAADDQILAMSSSPEHPLIVFAATYHGLLESEDGGKTWKARKGPPSERIMGVLALSDKTVLAGTSDGIFRTSDGVTWVQCGIEGVVSLHRSGPNMISALTAHGALASADQGATWKKCGSADRASAWYSIDFDSRAGETALAATSSGLFRSTDGCQSWSPALSGLRQETASLVLFHPTRSGEAYASQGGRVFRTTDGGKRWVPLDDGVLSNSGPTSLVVLPASPDLLFALFPRRGVFSISIKESHFND
jgi:photosystem II stability/assembly factor-like uncharacterized protein